MAIVTTQTTPATVMLTTNLLHSSTAGMPTSHVSTKAMATATRMKITVMLMVAMAMLPIMAMLTIMATPTIMPTRMRTMVIHMKIPMYTITGGTCIRTMVTLMKTMAILTRNMVIRMKTMTKDIST